MRTETKRSAISFQRSAGGRQSSVFSYQMVGLRHEEEVENRLAAHPRLWKSLRKATMLMKISNISKIGVDFMRWAKNMAIEKKALISLVWGRLAKKKGAPK